MRFPPRLIKGLEKPATKLKQLSLSNRTFDESWLQELIYNNPGLLPAGEIDSNYSKLIPLGREISTPSGSIDNLYVTPKGNLCLVETKLWRNPEAHRMLAQLIDYAKTWLLLHMRTRARSNSFMITERKALPASWI